MLSLRHTDREDAQERESAMATTAKYDAFISYSSRDDGRLAPSLQRALERFAKPWYRVRESRIFHDNSGLNVTEALWPRLHEIICESEHFLLLASPDSADKYWVQRELDHWLGHQGSPEKLIIIQTGGEISWDREDGDFDWKRTTALPRGLGKRFANEPFWLTRSSWDRGE